MARRSASRPPAGATPAGSGTAERGRAAGRDYAGVIGHVDATWPQDRGSIVFAITSARSSGPIDDTHDAGTGRSDRCASPTAALTNVVGPSTLTPDLAITVFGTTRLPWLPVRVSGIYQR